LLLQVSNLTGHLELYKDMAGIIGRSFSRIRSYVALCAANYMKEQHLFSLRMNRHESEHISTLLNNHLQRYFVPDGQNFMSLERDKRQHLIENMKGATQLISNMATNIGVITGAISDEVIKGKRDRLGVYDIFFKWRIMLMSYLQERNLDFIVELDDKKSTPYYFPSDAEDAPRYIYTHPGLFELLVYNLMDNAVKYAHRGSNIFLSWHRLHNSSDYELTVSSFGPQVTEDERIYDLYVRVNTTQFSPVGGEGIGLYVVKRIAKLLKINVTHTCEPVSEQYHLPLVDWYIAERFGDIWEKRKQEKLREYKNQKHNFNWNDIISMNPRTNIDPKCDLSPQYLRNRIDKGTWLTTFTVSVPMDMKWNPNKTK
jgi:signal transduction histidine kinase